MKFIFVSIIAVLLIFGACLQEKKWSGNEFSGNWEILTEANITDTIPFRPIKFFDKNNGIAVRSLSIQRTVDGGKNWDVAFYEDNIGIFSGVFTSESEGWVVGSDNLEKPFVLKTTDKGISWKRINFDEKSTGELKGKILYFRDICFDNKDTAWIVGEGGVVQVDTQKQDLKLLSLFSTKESLYRISCNGSGDIWADSSKNSVFYFREGWVKKELDANYSFSSVKSIGSDVWLIGKDDSGKGILLKSQDGGKTWDNKAPESAKALNDLYLKNGKGWLIGDEGSIYYSSDNGNSWVKSESPTKVNLLNIFFLDSNNIWISGDRATILKYQN